MHARRANFYLWLEIAAAIALGVTVLEGAGTRVTVDLPRAVVDTSGVSIGEP